MVSGFNMRLGIKGKQVLGVTVIVGVVVVAVSLMHLAQLAKTNLDDSGSRAELLASAISYRASAVPIVGDPYEALHADAALRSVLEASLNDPAVTVAAIADLNGIAVLNVDESQEGRPLPVAANLRELLARPAFSQLLAIYLDQGRNLDYAQPLFKGDQPIGSIHIGVSTLLIRRELNRSLGPAAITALGALAIAVFGASILAQLLLRPIHVIRSGLTRLGRGKTGVQLESAAGGRVRRARYLLQHRQRATRGRSNRRWPARWLTSSRLSNISRMPSRSSVLAVACSSSTRPCGRFCRRPASAHRSISSSLPITRCVAWPRTRSAAGTRAGRRRPRSTSRKENRENGCCSRIP
ncbi:MAG: hypothetical protein QM736_14410 [Vicinamibacterales bacterium]